VRSPASERQRCALHTPWTACCPGQRCWRCRWHQRSACPPADRHETRSEPWTAAPRPSGHRVKLISEDRPGDLEPDRLGYWGRERVTDLAVCVRLATSDVPLGRESLDACRHLNSEAWHPGEPRLWCFLSESLAVDAESL